MRPSDLANDREGHRMWTATGPALFECECGAVVARGDVSSTDVSVAMAEHRIRCREVQA